MSNILKAFINISNDYQVSIETLTHGNNRANNIGEGLESYIKDTISNGINTIADVEFTETKELGKVKKVDPLGITDLRIREMWHIENPNKIFSYLYEYDERKDFQLICLITRENYDSLPSEDREAIEVLDVRVKSPDNPVKLMEAKLLVFKI